MGLQALCWAAGTRLDVHTEFHFKVNCSSIVGQQSYKVWDSAGGWEAAFLTGFGLFFFEIGFFVYRAIHKLAL